MEEFARGFPNQHTTHRDTRYICMQTFVSARGSRQRGRRGETGGRQEGRTGGTMERGDSAITSVGVGCTRGAYTYLYACGV